MPHLTPARLRLLARAAEAAGLGFPDRRRLLLAGLPAGFVASLPVLDVPRLQLVSDLQRLNTVDALPAGVLPLRVWLDNARLLLDGAADTAPFVEVLALLRRSPGEPPPPRARSGHRRSREQAIFISHADAELDRAWAAWLAAVLETAGHRVRAAVLDDIPGGNWTATAGRALDEGGIVLAVLSTAYLASARAEQEWTLAALPEGAAATRLVPVFVERVRPPGFLRLRTGVDLCGLVESAAEQVVRTIVDESRPASGDATRTSRPRFPGPSR